MGKTGTWVAGIAVLLLAGPASAAESREAPPQAPKPSPEQKELGYFVGVWSSEGEIQANPFMPTGKFTSTDRCEWFEGHFAVVCHTEGSGPMGETKGLSIMSYSNEEKVYTYYGTDSSGMSMTTVPRGKVTGDEWVYDDEMTMGGMKIKNRYTMNLVSQTRYTFRWQIVDDKGEWATVMEGTARKAQ